MNQRPTQFTKKASNFLLPLLVSLVLAGATIAVWFMFRYDLRRAKQVRAEVTAEQSALRLHDFVHSRLFSVENLGFHSDFSTPWNPKRFTQHAQSVLKNLPGLLAINWVDDQGIIRIVLPEAPNRAALNRDLKTHPSASKTFLRAMREKTMQVTPPIDLYQGGKGIAAYVPVMGPYDSVVGYLNAVFRLAPLVEASLGQKVSSHYAVGITSATDTLYASAQDPFNLLTKDSQRVHATQEFDLFSDVRWTLTLVPLETEEHGALLSQIFLFSSLLLVVIFGILLGKFLEGRSDLHANAVFHSQLISTMNEGLIVVDDAGLVQLANKRMASLLGVDAPLEGRSIADMFAEQENFCAHEFSDPKFSAAPRELLWRRQDQSTFPSLVSCRALPNLPTNMSLCVVMDVSEQVKAQREKQSMQTQLIQAQKMEAIGRLAAGVAHDFNNTLTAVRGFAELLTEDLAPESQGQADAQEIVKATDHAEALTRRLLSLSRQQSTEQQFVTVDESLRNVSQLLNRLVRPDIKIHTRPNSQNAKILIDPSHIEHIATNLVVNARDALPDGGEIILSSGLTELDPADIQGTGLSPGEHVWLEVSDTGCGIDEKNLSQVLEPFFTTKEEGQGTGLGLSTVYGMVRAASGHLTIDSSVGLGTAVRLLFPLAKNELRKNEFSVVPKTQNGHGELILVIEDEDLVRAMVKRILTRANYQVLEASDGRRGLEIFHNRAAEIAVLISDMLMPEMSGAELYKKVIAQAQEQQLQTQILLMTGYANEALLRSLHGPDGPPALLRKPFSSQALLQQVQKLIRVTTTSVPKQ